MIKHNLYDKKSKKTYLAQANIFEVFHSPILSKVQNQGKQIIKVWNTSKNKLSVLNPMFKMTSKII